MNTQTIILKKNNNVNVAPVFLSGNELFIKTAGSEQYNVIRPVSQSDLDYFRSDEGIRNYIREIWKSAVMGDRTEQSLDEYIQDCMNEVDTGDDEAYINKDTTFCDIFEYYPGLREAVDKIVAEDLGEPVGTWESAGFYHPEYEIQAVFEFED